MAYTKLIYHIVLRTQYGVPAIVEAYERDLYMYIYGFCKNHQSVLYRINGMPDHVHILVDIGSKISLTDFVKQLKQESSYLIKRDGRFLSWNGWADGYGAFTYSISEIPTVVEYIANQKTHHKKVSFIDEYRQWLIEMGVSPDEPYFPRM
jgi:REP element-mobilizing transposase RayT